MTDITPKISEKTGSGEYAPGTLPRTAANTLAMLLRFAGREQQHIDHETIACAGELIGSLLYCLDTANAEVNSARAKQHPVRELPLALAGKLANLVVFNNRRLQFERGAPAVTVGWPEPRQRLDGLAVDNELTGWAWAVYQLQDAIAQDALESSHHNAPAPQPAASDGTVTHRRLMEHLEFAWIVIANAAGGDWNRESDEWRTSAVRWRDGWHTILDGERAARERPAAGPVAG